jgi:hypothetical protein
MHPALKTILAIIAGAALGLFLTWATVMRSAMPGDVKDGPWHTSLDIGSKAGGALLRARVALHGLFALGRKETVYYSATTDSDGTPLSGDCSYRINGRDPKARWWSMTAYGADDFLIPNRWHIYSISRSALVRKHDGRFVGWISPRRPKDDKDKDLPNWIPVSDAPFSLTLRLYNPDADVVAAPTRAGLPQIKRWSCP